MKNLISTSILLFNFIAFISCTGNSAKTELQSTGVLENSPLQNPETADKNSPEYQPVFAGQTRTQGVKTKTAYNVEIINKDLEKPCGFRCPYE
jgi:hypothetical protein